MNPGFEVNTSGTDLSVLSLTSNDGMSNFSINSSTTVSGTFSTLGYSPIPLSPDAKIQVQDLKLHGLLAEEFEDYNVPLNADGILDFEFDANGEMIDVSPVRLGQLAPDHASTPKRRIEGDSANAVPKRARTQESVM